MRGRTRWVRGQWECVPSRGTTPVSHTQLAFRTWAKLQDKKTNGYDHPAYNSLNRDSIFL